MFDLSIPLFLTLLRDISAQPYRKRFKIGNNNKAIPDLNDFIARSGAMIKTRTEAFCSPKGDFIGMPDISTFINSANYGATVLHELSHWTGAEHRLNRNLMGKFGAEDYAKEELVAELSAAMLCSHFQIEGDLRHAEYLQSWLKALKAEPKLLWKSASEAQKVFDYLMGIAQIQAKVAQGVSCIKKRYLQHYCYFLPIYSLAGRI